MGLVYRTSSIFIYMGKRNTSKYFDIKIGDTFDKWTVVGLPFMDKYAKVPCQCQCGAYYNVDAYTLTNNKSKSCKVCSLPRVGSVNPSWRGYKEIPNSWFLRFKRYSKIEFNIQIEDVWDLYVRQDKRCALTGLPISFANELARGKKYSGINCTASLDRVNSQKGYTKDNIQLVHKDINIMKNAYDQSYFINLCKLIVEHSKQE